MRPTLVACLFLLMPVTGLAQPISPPPVAAPPLPLGNEPAKPAPAQPKPSREPPATPPADTNAPPPPRIPPPAPPPAPAAIPSEITVSPPPVAPPPLGAVSTGPPVVVADNTEIPQGIENRRRLVLPSQRGPVGLYRLTAADAGDVGQVRLALHGEYGSSDDFLVPGSRDRRLAGTLSVGFTPHRFVELFGAILASANQNQRCATGKKDCLVENDRADPPTIRAFGDLVFGGKLAAPVLPWIGLGAEAGARLFAANDGLSLDGDATSAWLNALSSVNLRELSNLPLLVHVNLGYYLDNSKNLQDFSQFRPSMLPSRLVTSFAYGMGSSRVRSGVGVAAPLPGDGIGVALEPYAEYHVELVTGDPEPAYSAYMPPECDMPARKCIDNRDQQWLSFGLRAQLRGGFAVSAGVDLTLRSVGFPYGPALLPWNLIIGVAQSFDFSGPPKTVTRTVTLQRTVERPPPPKEGFVHGKVTNAEVIGEPIAGAVVSVIGQNRGRVATDIDGSFATKGLPPGSVKLEISAPSFEPQVIEARIAIGKTTEVGASLRPALPPPRIEGRVSDTSNRPLLTARIRIVGPTSADLASDSSGRFTAELAPGSYVATIDAPGRVPLEQRFDLKPGLVFPLEVSLSLERAPAVVPTGETPAAATYQHGRLVLRRPLTFRITDGTPTAELAPGSRTTLEALAGVLKSNPAITRVRIEAHWDSGVGREQAQTLTTQQAQAVVDFLVIHGVARDRLDPVGVGADRPLVPNLSPTVRAKNRRIEITPITR